MLLIKNLAIISAVIWFCWTVYGIEIGMDRWQSTVPFGIAACFCLSVAIFFVWIFVPSSGWRIMYLVEYSWTYAGDITVLFVSFGYAFGLVFVGRLLRR